MAKKLIKLLEESGATKFNSLKEAGVTYTPLDESAIFKKGDIIMFPKGTPEFWRVPIEGTNKTATCTIVYVNGEEKRFFPSWIYKSCKNEETSEIFRPNGSVYEKLKKERDLDKILKALFKSGGAIILTDIQIVPNYKYSTKKDGTGVVRSFDFVE